MLIHTCDNCDTKLGGSALDRRSIHVSLNVGYGIELCKPCAAPIIQFLTSAQLLQAQLEQYGFIESSV